MSQRKPTTDWNEFVDEWRPELAKIARRLGVRDFDDVEDCVQCVIEKIARDDGLNKYDPLRGAFSTYVHAVARVETRNFITRLYRDRGRFFTDSKLSRDDRSYIELNAVDTFDVEEHLLREEFWVQAVKAEAALAKIPVRSFATVQNENGEVERRPRSHLMVFLLLCRGMEQKDIAAYLNYSPSSVNLLSHQLSQVPEVRRLRAIWTGVNMAPA